MITACVCGICLQELKVRKYLIKDAKLNVESESMSAFPVANFDPFGLVFGVAWSEQQK